MVIGDNNDDQSRRWQYIVEISFDPVLAIFFTFVGPKWQQLEVLVTFVANIASAISDSMHSF